MLYILTGNIQIGKTRWLQAQLGRLLGEGVTPYGVIAPGDWVPDGEGGFDKQGIFNQLLPDGPCIEFAKRRDLVDVGDVFDQGEQARREKLGWAISDDAIAQVDAYFAQLLQDADAPRRGRGLLVVDELGRLELLRGEGLVNAMKLLDKGPTALV